MKKRLEKLRNIGLPLDALAPLVANIAFLKDSHPIGDETDYLNEIQGNQPSRMRDEFIITGVSIVNIYSLIAKTIVNSTWREAFDVTFLWQAKSLIQSFHSVDQLCLSKCYIDAASILRTIHSRVQQIILFSFNPFLFNDWLSNPKDEKFLDGHIRKELSKHKIYLYPHFYDWLSETIHGHEKAQLELGYLKKGLFSDIPNVENSIYIIGKFYLGVAGLVGLYSVIEDADEQIPAECKEVLIPLYGHIKNEFMAVNRVDQFFTILAEDRHLEKVGKNQYSTRIFDLDEYRRQLSLFHRKSKPKYLSKKYNVLDKWS